MATLRAVWRTGLRTALFGTVAAVVVALAPHAAGAATTYLYVGGAGCSDSGTGSQTQPFCTIIKAGTVATAGQTVLVASGTYAGTVSVTHSGLSGSPIVFQPAAGASVTIQGGQYGFSIAGQSYVTVTGFSITQTTSYGINVSNANNITISGNTVTYSGKPVSGQIAAGISLSGVSASLVSHNVADHNSDSGIYLRSNTTSTVVSDNEASFNAEGYQRNANGINVIAPGNTILRNVLHDNEDSGLQFYPGGNNNLAAENVSYNNGDHGIDDLNVTGGRLIGNTIYHNCTTGINVEGTSGNYIVQDNIAVDNAVYPAYNGISCNRRTGNIGIWDSAPPTTIVDYNLVYLTKAGTMYVFGSSYTSLAAMQAATGQEQHGLQADPKFVSTASWNLQLQAGSPAIDSANSGVSGAQATDALGQSRVDDPATPNTGAGPRTYDDRGGYEYQPSGTPPPAQPPVAKLTVTPTSGTVPLPVTADASASTDPQGQALTYAFNFGDGTTVPAQTQPTAGHTYQTAGTYTVTVTVTDTSGLSSTATATVTASSTAAQPPVANLTVTPTSGTVPLTVTADASASTDPQGQALTYAFNFGDGTTVPAQTQPSAGHTYQTAGTYTVTVTVTDTSGLSSTATATVTASAPPTGTSNAAYVGQIARNYSTNVHTSGYVTVWKSQGVVAGHLIVVTLVLTGTSPTGAVTGTDDVGDTLTVASDVADGSGDRLVVLSGLTNKGLIAGQHITVQFPTAASYQMIGDEVSGVIARDVNAGAAGSGSSFSSGPTGTTANTKEFVFGAVAILAGTSPTWSAGWTSLPVYAITTNYVGRSYQIPSTTGSFTASGTATGGWLATAVAFS